MKIFDFVLFNIFIGILFVPSIFAQINPITQWTYGNSTFYYESGLMDLTNSPDSLTVFLTNQEISCPNIPIDPHGIGGAWIEIKYPDLSIRNYALGEIWGTMSCWVIGPYYGNCTGYLGTAGLTAVNLSEKRVQGWIDFETNVLGYIVSAYGSFEVQYCESPVSVQENYYKNLPIEYGLFHNYPNPFNPTTKIEYQIPEISFVIIKVYDVLGTEIEILVNEEKSVGTYELNWNASNLPSGVYFYRLQTGSFVETKKMVLMK